ncbi:MAG: cytochrome c [Erythrobacter sp.]|nr:cytochrome c [Erythrobacter sp.]
MKWLYLALPLSALAVTASVAAQSQGSQAQRGQQLFTHFCAPCHGQGAGDDRSDMLPGTAALARRYQGAKPAALELRTDLPAPVLTLFVRRGVGPMPAFRPSELSDADVAAIAAYLAQPD